MADKTNEVQVKSPPGNPEDSFFPECWKDDDRMGHLLAEFRPKTVNPVSYDSKMKFWKEMISSYCRTTGSSVVSVVNLKEAFRRKGTVPYCLTDVFDDMIAKGELIPRDHLNEQTYHASLSWGPWAVERLMKAPLKWGYETARQKIVGSKSDIESRQFILKDCAKIHGDVIEKIVCNEDLCNRVINKDKLIRLVKQLSNISEGGIQAALELLEQNKRLVKEMIVTEERPFELFKFPRPNVEPQRITDIERSIYELEQTETMLMTSINKIEHDIVDTMNQIRTYIKDGRKNMAKANLKKKHNYEKNLQSKITALENLQEILAKIHESQSNKNVIEAYKLGSKTLKQAFAESGITLDSVDETLAEMKDLLEQHDEMLNMIGTKPFDDVDELELEQELSDLIDMNAAESNINGNNLLPSPPTSALTQPSPSNIDSKDFDKEIEKRLTALRFDATDAKKCIEGQIKMNV